MRGGDQFFTQTHCDRCPNPLPVRILSWFTRETLCMDCSKKEQELRKKLPDMGKDYEGCGYIPTETGEVPRQEPVPAASEMRPETGDRRILWNKGETHE